MDHNHDRVSGTCRSSRDQDSKLWSLAAAICQIILLVAMFPTNDQGSGRYTIIIAFEMPPVIIATL